MSNEVSKLSTLVQVALLAVQLVSNAKVVATKVVDQQVDCTVYIQIDE